MASADHMGSGTGRGLSAKSESFMLIKKNRTFGTTKIVQSHFIEPSKYSYDRQSGNSNSFSYFA